MLKLIDFVIKEDWLVLSESMTLYVTFRNNNNNNNWDQMS